MVTPLYLSKIHKKLLMARDRNTIVISPPWVAICHLHSVLQVLSLGEEKQGKKEVFPGSLAGTDLLFFRGHWPGRIYYLSGVVGRDEIIIIIFWIIAPLVSRICHNYESLPMV
jgi:hypothetical protein